MRNNSISIILITLFLIPSSLIYSQSIAGYRSQFNEAIVSSNDDTGVGATLMIGQRLETFRGVNTGTTTNKKIDLYLDIWEIKHLFLDGQINKAIEKFNSLKINKMLCGELPYYKTIKTCSEQDQGCDCNEESSILNDLDPVIDNLDFLKDEKFHEYFIDVAIEINRGDQTSIPIREAAHVLKNNKPVELLISPPKIKLRIDKYGRKSEKNEVIKYYLKTAQKRMREQLDKNFRNKESQKLEFYKRNEDENNYHFIFNNIPRITGGSGDPNASYYKVYILENGNAIDRYSFKLKQKKQKKNNVTKDETVLIRWNSDWVMQKWKDDKHVFFLFPTLYQYDYLLKGQPIVNSELLEGQELIKIKTKINKEDFDLLDYPDQDSNITDDKTIEVYKIAAIYDENGEISLNYTDKYKPENDTLKKQKKYLMYTVLGCIGVLLAAGL